MEDRHVDPALGEGPPPLEVEIDAVQSVASSLGTVIVRVAGRWPSARTQRGADSYLLVGEGSTQERLPALAEASEGAERATADQSALRAVFSLEGPIQGALALELGGHRITLPAPSQRVGEVGVQARVGVGNLALVTDGGTVVDRAVIAERRARRAEDGEGQQRTRAEVAEQAAAALKIEAIELRSRLQDATAGPLEQPSSKVAIAISVESQLARTPVRQTTPRPSAVLLSDALSDLLARERKMTQGVGSVVARPTKSEALPNVSSSSFPATTGGQPGSVADALDRLDRERRAAPEMRRVIQQRDAEIATLRSELERASEDLRSQHFGDGVATAAAKALENAERRIGEARAAALAAQNGLVQERAEWASVESDLRSELARAREGASTVAGQVKAIVEPEPIVEPEAAVAPASPEPHVAVKPWLPEALVALSAADPAASARLALTLLPAAGISTTKKHKIDLKLYGVGRRRVDLEPGAVSITQELQRPRGTVAAEIRLDGPTLVALITEGPSRSVRRRAGVGGTWRRRRALGWLGPIELDLAILSEAGVHPDPTLLFAALSQRIDPEWTRGHSFVVLQTIVGPTTTSSFTVTVEDGSPVRVASVDGDQSVNPNASVRFSQAAYLRLLSGRSHPSGDRPALRGDNSAVTLLAGWVGWAQGIGAPDQDAV